jgi:hypothetical protein
MSVARKIILSAIVLVIFVGVNFWLWNRQMPVPQDMTTTRYIASSSPTASSSIAVASNCDQATTADCFGINDNGRIVAIVPTSRVTIELPSALYNKDAVIITPSNSLGETFGATAALGNWVRTFEATQVGTTTISIPSLQSSTPPYSLTLRVVGPSDAWENGMTIVTQENNDGAIYLVKNERFLIQFGNGLNWTLGFDPATAISRIPNSTVTNGFQGVYQADATGTVILRATGRPICKSEMCAQYLVEETIRLIIN